MPCWRGILYPGDSDRAGTSVRYQTNLFSLSKIRFEDQSIPKTLYFILKKLECCVLQLSNHVLHSRCSTSAVQRHFHHEKTRFEDNSIPKTLYFVVLVRKALLFTPAVQPRASFHALHSRCAATFSIWKNMFWGSKHPKTLYFVVLEKKSTAVYSSWATTCFFRAGLTLMLPGALCVIRFFSLRLSAFLMIRRPLAICIQHTHRSLPVLPLWPIYRDSHPENYLFLLSKDICIGSKYPKTKHINFERKLHWSLRRVQNMLSPIIAPVLLL